MGRRGFLVKVLAMVNEDHNTKGKKQKAVYIKLLVYLLFLAVMTLRILPCERGDVRGERGQI